MAISSKEEIRDSVLDTTRQEQSQIGDLVDEFINLSLHEIENPAWAYGRKGVNHLWSFLKQKTTFTTVNGTSDYVMPREVDRIAFLRQTATPTKIYPITDEQFFRLIPDPTDTGNPKYYRLWEIEGVSTKLSTADTIDLYSSSTSDSGNSDLAVSVTGYSDGILRTETYQLNGTNTVSGSITFDAREIWVSKQRDTTGTVTVVENSGATTLVKVGPKERAPRFKVVTLYPTPSSAITIYLQFHTRMRELSENPDTPPFDQKWHYVVRLGALAKTYQYLNKEGDFASAQALFAAAVRSMVESDKTQPDLVEHLQPRADVQPNIRLKRTEDAIS